MAGRTRSLKPASTMMKRWPGPLALLSVCLMSFTRQTSSPAMYGSYHHISIVGKGAGRAPEPFVVAGPLCESGDVFTRDDKELLDPRELPRPDVGDLLVLHDAGAYGAAMSSNYVSIGRAPQVYWEDGRATLASRRETIDDVVRAECDEPL